MIRVGVAGWSYKDWEGIVYPARKPRGFHGLEHLARFTDVMEVNGSFYAMPRAEHAAQWARLTERESARAPFCFTAKLHQDFTHGAALDERAFAHAVEVFRAGVEPLRRAGRLTALLAQFPVSFARTPAAEAHVERLCDAFGDNGLAFELRHRSWFEARGLELLRRRGASLLSIDLPAAADHPPPRFAPTGPLGYLRLHGRNARAWFTRGAGRDERYDYLYGPRELDELQQTALDLEAEHAEVYVVSNNHFQGQALVNALELRARLEGAPVAAPAELVARYPRLAAVTRTSGQQSLF
ncbi:MAG: DUF72 domain-containing protein [Planctomycetes bacterium]|nr:DUF72 domain-containing protein [Planctomycetota bacterium]